MPRSKPKKPNHYPKKFRQKLERVANGRETHEAETAIDVDLPPIFNTFYKSFLPRNSVDTMLARVDEVLNRVDVTSWFRRDPPVKRVTVRPPWEGEGGASR